MIATKAKCHVVKSRNTVCSFPPCPLSSIQLYQFLSQQHSDKGIRSTKMSDPEGKSTLNAATSQASTTFPRPSLSSTVDGHSNTASTLVGKESASSVLNDKSSTASTIVVQDPGDSAGTGKTTKTSRLPGLRKRLARLQKFWADQQEAHAVQEQYIEDCKKRQAEKNDGGCPCGYPWGKGRWFHSCSISSSASAHGGGGGGDTGCFGGGSVVWMTDRRHKLVKDLRQGDRIRCDTGGQIAEVRCVVAMRIPGSRAHMVHFPDGLAITPTHPVLDSNGEWVPAEKMYESRVVDIDRVYNFLLDRQHTIMINDVTCVVMGHGGSMKHGFWGNWDGVARCLRKVDPEGFRNGLVEVAGTVRNETTGLVNGFLSLDGRRITEIDSNRTGYQGRMLSRQGRMVTIVAS